MAFDVAHHHVLISGAVSDAPFCLFMSAIAPLRQVNELLI